MTWIFLFVFGALSLLASLFAVFTSAGGIIGALPGLAVAAVFFSLARMLGYLEQIVERQKRIEALLEKKSDEK